MSHRIINRDGYAECFACGIAVEFTSDTDTQWAFSALPCKPGGWEHPPYVYPPADEGDWPTFETCAAHPYGSCEWQARKVAEGLTAIRAAQNAADER